MVCFCTYLAASPSSFCLTPLFRSEMATASNHNGMEEAANGRLQLHMVKGNLI